jgi:hypothetical protein
MSKKDKFYFLNDDGSKRAPQENDCYYQYECAFFLKWPFFKKIMVGYKLINGEWVRKYI